MGKGPDVRWVGTESGYGRTTEVGVIPLPTPPEQFNWPDWQGADLGSRAAESRQLPLVVPGRDERDHARQRPVVLGHQAPAPGAAAGGHLLLQRWRNSNLILNLSPDQRGLRCLTTRWRRCADGRDHPQDLGPTSLQARASAATTRPQAMRPGAVVDGKLGTWWEAALGGWTAR